MKALRNEYWDHDPQARRDECAKIWEEMPRTDARRGDEAFEDWIAAGHAGRRQQALHTHRAFASLLHEYEEQIDRGEPLVDLLAERFRVSVNAIKWLRYCRDSYAEYICSHYRGHRFAILCHWLNQVYKLERPNNPDDLRWFVLGNRFNEWQTGLFGGDTASLAQGVRGRWREYCHEIGAVQARTQHLEHRFLAEVAFRWRELFALEVIRRINTEWRAITTETLTLAITPSRQDLRDTGFNFGRLQFWSYNLSSRTPVDDPSYWLKRSLDPEDRPTDPRTHRFSVTVADRAEAIVADHYEPEPLLSLAPRDHYPVERRRRRRFA